MSNTIAGPDGKLRCRWSAAAPEFLQYHDTEWGYPVGDECRLFEKICLEGFQSGLLVFSGFGICWVSATIARYVYPPPKRWQMNRRQQ